MFYDKVIEGAKYQHCMQGCISIFKSLEIQAEDYGPE